MKTIERLGKSMKSKRISVSEKRQITIPKEYYDALNIGNEIECSIMDNCIIIKPITENSLDEFSEYILQDIIKEGYTNEDILKEFKKRREDLKKATNLFKKSVEEEIENIEILPTAQDVFGNGDDN